MQDFDICLSRAAGCSEHAERCPPSPGRCQRAYVGVLSFNLHFGAGTFVSLSFSSVRSHLVSNRYQTTLKKATPVKKRHLSSYSFLKLCTTHTREHADDADNWHFRRVLKFIPWCREEAVANGAENGSGKTHKMINLYSSNTYRITLFQNLLLVRVYHEITPFLLLVELAFEGPICRISQARVRPENFY